jgi:glycosyltransferase involved in cell wall biosynthesis
MEGYFRIYMAELSVIIPVFNESELLEELVKRVKLNMGKITEDYEIVLIDDGSHDATWDKIVNESHSEKRIKGIKFSRNFGHHYAITAGLHQASGEWVVVMDGDLQDRPEVIPQLFDKAQEGFDVVFVSRQNRPEKLYYRVAQKLFYWSLRKLSGIDFDSSQANFSIINRKVVDGFKNFPENARFYGSTIKWLGFKRTYIFADHGVRYAGKPSYTLRKRFKLAADIILSFSERPLKFAIGLGGFMSLFSLFMTFWLGYRVIFESHMLSPWTSLIAAICFSTGVILIVIGISGIYIGEIFRQVKNRPLYVIEKRF